MDTRKITYASTTSAAADPKTVFSAAETWGDLKKEDADIDTQIVFRVQSLNSQQRVVPLLPEFFRKYFVLPHE